MVKILIFIIASIVVFIVTLLSIKITIWFVILNIPLFFRVNMNTYRSLSLMYALILDVFFTTIFFSLFSYIVLFLFNHKKILYWSIFPIIIIAMGVGLDFKINQCLNDKQYFDFKNHIYHNRTCDFLLKYNYIEYIELNNKEYILRPKGVFLNYLIYE